MEQRFLDCIDDEMMEDALENLPETLEGLYADLLRQIRKDYREKARLILVWLTYSLQPLSLRAMASAASIPNPQKVLEICTSSLVSLQRDNSPSSELEHEHRNIENDVVKLDHFSVKEYLTSRSILTSEDTACFHADPLIAHLTMAEISVSHLIRTNDISIPQRNNTISDTKIIESFESHQSEFPLLDYSIMWYKHIQQADAIEASARKSGEQRSEALAEATHLLRDKCHRLLSGNYPGSFENWLVLFRPSADLIHLIWSLGESSPLVMASLLDLSDNVRRLLDDGANVDGDLEIARSRPRLTSASNVVRKFRPVYGAAIAGSLESLRLLLKEGATLDQSEFDVVVRTNSRHEVEVLTTILEARPSLGITDDTIIASAENFHSKELLNYILDNQKSLTKFELEVIAKNYWSCPRRLDVLEKVVSYGKTLDCDGDQMLRAFLQSKILYADLEIQILIDQYDPSYSMVQEIVSWVLQDEYLSRWKTKAILSHFKKAGVEVVFTPDMEIIRKRHESRMEWELEWEIEWERRKKMGKGTIPLPAVPL